MDGEPFPTGCLIGSVLVDGFLEPYANKAIIEDHIIEWWEEDKFGWILSGAKVFKEPTYEKGRQWIWYADLPEGMVG